jgi:hypothetical protein
MVDHIHRNIKKLKKNRYRLPKYCFFRDYTTWYSSNFYGTERAHLNVPVEMKIEISKKLFFPLERGRSP